MFFGASAKITNITDLETELSNLGFYFNGDAVVIGPVTFDFGNDWTDDFVQDVSLVSRLEYDKILGPPDLANKLHSNNKIFINFEDIADEVLLLATTVYIMQNKSQMLSSLVNSASYNKNIAISPAQVPVATPAQGTLPLNYGNSNAPQASLTPAPAGLKQKLSKAVSYASKSNWQPVAQLADEEKKEAEDEEYIKATPIVCDCGAFKANTTHADWCSLKQ